VASDLIPTGSAEIILSVEPMEALRYLPFLKADGYIVTNTTPFKNIPNYPSVEEIMQELEKQPRCIALDADTIAKDIGNKRASNMVMLGAATPFIQITPDKIEAGIERVFSKKGEAVVQLNLEAFRAGRAFALENK
jgi:indolepyruvate ferredoxin oxidoreductase beta subunit